MGRELIEGRGKENGAVDERISGEARGTGGSARRSGSGGSG